VGDRRGRAAISALAPFGVAEADEGVSRETPAGNELLHVALLAKPVLRVRRAGHDSLTGQLHAVLVTGEAVLPVERSNRVRDHGRRPLEGALRRPIGRALGIRGALGAREHGRHERGSGQAFSRRTAHFL
jgi:hypothetical protein